MVYQLMVRYCKNADAGWWLVVADLSPSEFSKHQLHQPRKDKRTISIGEAMGWTEGTVFLPQIHINLLRYIY